jgi:hypothetical protein
MTPAVPAWALLLVPVPDSEILEELDTTLAFDGHWSHPGIPWQREPEEVPLNVVFRFIGFELLVKEPDETVESARDWWRASPSPLEDRPSGEGWVLVSVHDSEDGAVAWWLRPLPQLSRSASAEAVYPLVQGEFRRLLKAALSAPGVHTERTMVVPDGLLPRRVVIDLAVTALPAAEVPS